MATNLFRKTQSLYASTANTFSTGDSETITPASVAGLPTDTEMTLTFDRVDSGGTETPTKMERIIGVVTGGNFVSRVTTGRGADGSTEQAHTSPVVEYIPNAKDMNDAVDGILVEHTQAGKHNNVTASSIAVTNNVTASTVNIGTTVAMTGTIDAASAVSATALVTSTYVGKITTEASSATPTPTGGRKVNEYYATALEEAAEFAAPSETPVNGNKLIIRVKDDGTARALTYNSVYSGIVDTLPSTTILGKVMYMGFIYNSTTSKWEFVAKVQE